MFEQIAAMIADQLGIDASTIKPESRLVEDLKADSLDVVADDHGDGERIRHRNPR